MKLILSFVILSLFIYSIESTCTSMPQIISGNTDCSGTSGEVCEKGYYCGKNGFCTLTSAENAQCTNPNQCLPYSCTNSVCKPTKNVQVGGACSSISDCASTRAQCAGGVCIVSSCSSNTDCAFGQVCSGNGCGNPKNLGEECIGHGECKQGLACTYDVPGNKTICAQPFQTPLNIQCIADGNIITDCDIGQGLYCSSQKICEKVNSNPCQSCREDSDCTFSNNCLCGGINTSGNSVGFCKAPRVYDTTCKAAVSTFIQCANDNSCVMTSAFFNEPDTCLYNKCSQQMKALVNCNRINFPPSNAFRSIVGFSKSLPSNCSAPITEAPVSTKTPKPEFSSSSTLSVSFLIAFISIILSLLN